MSFTHFRHKNVNVQQQQFACNSAIRFNFCILTESVILDSIISHLICETLSFAAVLWIFFICLSDYMHTWVGVGGTVSTVSQRWLSFNLTKVAREKCVILLVTKGNARRSSVHHHTSLCDQFHNSSTNLQKPLCYTDFSLVTSGNRW